MSARSRRAVAAPSSTGVGAGETIRTVAKAIAAVKAPEARALRRHT